MQKEGATFYVDKTLKLVRRFVDDKFPNSARGSVGFRVTPNLRGLAISYGGGLTLVFSDLSEAKMAHNWQLQVTSGLIVDAPDVQNALKWANLSNRHLAYGRYFCAVAEQQSLAAVLYELTIYGGLINTYFDNPSDPRSLPVLSYITAMIRENVERAAEGSQQLLPLIGGRIFDGDDPNERGISELFAISSS